MEYFFRCSGCNTKERVDEDTFKRFISISWDYFLAAIAQEKAVGAILDFKEKCPFCRVEEKKIKANIFFLKEAQNPSTQAG